MKILVVNANALHVGYLGCYGNEWVETPTINRLAAEGVVFDQHFASHPGADGNSLPDGYGVGFPACRQAGKPAPHFNGIHCTQIAAAPDEADEAFLARAAAAMQALTDNELLWLAWPNLYPPWRIPETILDLYFGIDIVGADGPSPLLDPPLGLMAASPDSPPHTSPLSPGGRGVGGEGGWQGEGLDRLQDTYAAAVTWFDAQLESLLDLLEDDWLVVITAASGLALGEHGIIGRRRAWLHEELVHIPLLLRFPGKAYAGLRLSALTQPADLMATLAHLLQTSATAGPGLMPLIREEQAEIRPHLCSFLQVGDSIEWSLRTKEWAFLLPVQVPQGDPPRGPQLYVKPDDRWEVNNLHQKHLELAEEFEKVLRQAAASGAHFTDRNAAEREQENPPLA